MTDIAVVDYGMGNLRSVAKAIEHVAPAASRGHERSARVRGRARGVSRPGRDARLHARAGRARAARRRCSRRARQAVSSASASACRCCSSERGGRRPASGCCRVACPAFPAGEITRRIRRGLKVPHMGWNECTRRAHPLWEASTDGSRSISCTATTSSRGPALAPVQRLSVRRLPAPWRAINIFAVQFHPEKAERGLRLLANFVDWHGRFRARLGAGNRDPRSLDCPRRSCLPRHPFESLAVAFGHADHSGDRSEGRQLRPPEAGRDGPRRPSSPRIRRDGASTGSSRGAAAAPGRSERRGGRQAEERKRDSSEIASGGRRGCRFSWAAASAISTRSSATSTTA